MAVLLQDGSILLLQDGYALLEQSWRAATQDLSKRPSETALFLQNGCRTLNQGGELLLLQGASQRTKRKILVESQNRTVITSLRPRTVQNFTKYKDEALDFTLDWTKYLANSGADTITSSSWVEDSGGITIDSDTNTTKKATVWISGGTHGTTYTIENTIITSGGRTAKRALDVHVIELSTNTPSTGLGYGAYY
jgi:hypothetical protein